MKIALLIIIIFVIFFIFRMFKNKSYLKNNNDEEKIVDLEKDPKTDEYKPKE